MYLLKLTYSGNCDNQYNGLTSLALTQFIYHELPISIYITHIVYRARSIVPMFPKFTVFPPLLPLLGRLDVDISSLSECSINPWLYLALFCNSFYHLVNFRWLFKVFPDNYAEDSVWIYGILQTYGAWCCRQQHRGENLNITALLVVFIKLQHNSFNFKTELLWPSSSLTNFL